MTGQRSNHRTANNSPSRTCNSRTRNRSICSAATPTAASRRDNTAKDLQNEQRDSDRLAKAQRIEVRPVPARIGPGLAPASLRVPRLDGYSIVGGIGDRERTSSIVTGSVVEMTSPECRAGERIGMKPMLRGEHLY